MRCSPVCVFRLLLAVFATLVWAWTLPAQTPSPRATLTEQTAQGSTAGLPVPHGFQQYVKGGKLRLSLNDAILLALGNNTDIQLDQTQIDTAKNAVESARAPFDPTVTGLFNTERSTESSFSQAAIAPTLTGLTQEYQLGLSQTFETGTNVQTFVSATKFSSNIDFGFVNPSVFGTVSVQITQPLLRGRGLLVNRGPIIIAQRNLAQSRATFHQQVATVIFNAIQQYWNVVEARENLEVQQNLLAQAQQSYDHDKQALEKGALPPLDIYRSESQVAARRVAEIQAEYVVKQAEDTFRNVIGADLDPNIRALDLNLTQTPEPTNDLLSVDIGTELQKALVNRSEVEVQRLQLANDDLNIKIAHNGLEPQLSLTGIYSGYGLNTTTNGPFLEALDQTFGFSQPTYGGGLNLTLPVKNYAAKAAFANAQVSKRHDLYSDRQVRQLITLDVANAVHQLEQSKLSIEAAKIALNLAQKNMQAEQRKYELGAETLFVVLETQSELAQGEQSLIQAQVDYQLAVASVYLSTGELLSNFNVEIAGLEK
ncbi:MAG: TolC family protein [Candidatus Acidiferrales bacterium]